MKQAPWLGKSGNGSTGYQRRWMSCPPRSESRGQTSHKVPRDGVPTTHQLGPLPQPCPLAQLHHKAPGPSWLAKCDDIALQAAGITEPLWDVESPLACPTGTRQSVWPKGLSWLLVPTSSLWSPLPSYLPSTCGACKVAHQLCPGPSNGMQRD